MNNITKKIIAAMGFGMIINFSCADIPKVGATYRSASDTGTEIFDYIENRRREERANALTEEQKKLQADIAEANERLPTPIKEGQPIPAAFEGDDLVYNAATGEFKATGHVDVIQLEGYRFQSEEASGNIKTQEVRVKDRAHVLQLTDNAPRVTLDGYNTVYNYGKKTGTMGEARGKAGEYYISGKRFEFYPDHYVVYDATQTKCGAKNPDYHVSAERMEIYPEQVMHMYNVKLWIRDKVVGKRDYIKRTLEKEERPYFPRFGYDSDYGVYVEDSFEIPIKPPHVKGIINAHLNTKQGVRSNAELQYENRNVIVTGMYGYYHDDNANWIQKEPGLDIFFGKKFGGLPITYTLEYEIGHWRSEDASSLHQEYEIGFYHDAIELPGRYHLFLHTGYKITKDDVRNSDSRDREIRGMNYDVTLGKEFDERFAAYAGYHYNKANTKNSLYRINNEDYSSRVETGISYQLTEKDRIVAGWKFDTQSGSLVDTDYYWYRDLHCSTAVMRWRHKRKKLEVHWQFTPW